MEKVVPQWISHEKASNLSQPLGFLSTRDAFEVSTFFLGGVIKQNQNESQIFRDLFLL